MDDETTGAGRLPRQPKPVPPGSSATRFPDLLPLRERLDELRRQHLDVAALALTVDEGRLYSTDFLVTSMVQRSYGIVDALIDAVDWFNIHAAAPLLRIQLDTLFRAHYAASGPNSDELAMRLLAGEEFRKMKDPEGKNLNDGRLKDLAAAAHPWAPAVYDKTSGWVHFSLSHMVATVQVSGERDLFMGVPLLPHVIPESLWHEVYGASIQATEELFVYVRWWAARKGMPPGEFRDLPE
ncbi:hypothetical protein [Actinomyces oricola]|uniref:hypothetical protein n=1 Tax=Actinomyces oricola TaxID=206043 RepID=UPI000FFF1CC6|nr:hypothetical protein [Actinomyces oricola]